MTGPALSRRGLLLEVDADTTLDVLIDEPASAQPGGTDRPDIPAAPCPSMVLLPSSLRDSLDFDPLAERIAAAGWRVLRPQPRGMARSRGPLQGLDLNVLARDVAHVIEHCGDGHAIVAGHAFGHYVARVTDLNHPMLVRGVVVLAGAARVFPPGLTQALDTAADASQPRALRLDALRQAFFAPGNDAQAWLDGWHPALRGIYRRAAATPAKDVWWHRAHAPMLEVQGACDPWRPEPTRAELRNLLGGEQVTLRLITHASHALPAEQPVAAAEAIVEWAGALPG